MCEETWPEGEKRNFYISNVCKLIILNIYCVLNGDPRVTIKLLRKLGHQYHRNVRSVLLETERHKTLHHNWRLLRKFLLMSIHQNEPPIRFQTQNNRENTILQRIIKSISISKNLPPGGRTRWNTGAPSSVSPDLPLILLNSDQDKHNWARWARWNNCSERTIPMNLNSYSNFYCVNLPSIQVTRLAISSLCLKLFKVLGLGSAEDLRMTLCHCNP